MSSPLSYDILVQILYLLCDDYNSLFNCALVDHSFNNAATRLLYKRVWYSPEHRHVLDLKDRGTIEENSLLGSASIPHHASHVIEFEIAGYISTRPPPLFNLDATIVDAVKKFSNLSKISLCPATFHEDLFIPTLEYLPAMSHLNEVSVNSSCMSERTTPLLTRLRHLQRLTLHNPGRVILNALPAWLEDLSPGLVGLNLMDNCGSITPGVLKSFVPHVAVNLRQVTLGLSYSLSDEDVFSFLAQLPLLERLQLQYYFQLRSPQTKPRLTRLKSFTANYTSAATRPEVIALCRWVKHIIAFSPIEAIRLERDQGSDEAHIPFDVLVHHLAAKHNTTIRVFDFRHAYVSVEGLKTLLKHCNKLEELYVAVRKNGIEVFPEHARCLAHLHTAGFNIRNAKMKRALFDDEIVKGIFRDGPISFRRLHVNGASWEGAWVSREDGSVCFMVNRARGSG